MSKYKIGCFTVNWSIMTFTYHNATVNSNEFVQAAEFILYCFVGFQDLLIEVIESTPVCFPCVLL